VVRLVSAFLLIFGLAGCNRGVQSNDAVRQGVLDYLAQKAGMNVKAMDITLAAVKINGDQADATVNFTAKGVSAPPMTMQYHLEQKDGKWVVVGRQDSTHTSTPVPGGAGTMSGAAPGGENPHGGGAMPADNPHGGGAMAAPGAGGKMPAPEDLPPAGKKK
jgi:hypothetical protein